MKHRTGYLFKRGDTWYVRWSLDGKAYAKSLRDDNGQPITTRREAEVARDKLMKPMALASEAEALKAIAERSNTLESKLEKDRLVSQPPMEFARAWSEFLNSDKRKEQVKASQEVLDNYERQLDHFGKWIAVTHPEVKSLNQVTVPMAKSYRVHLAGSGRSPNTVNKYLAALLLIWNILRTEARIKENPWEESQIGRESKRSKGREAFTKEEIKKICEAAKGDMQNLFALAAMTGLRLKDCCLLKWSDVNLSAGKIRIVPAKTKRFQKEAVIPMPAALHRILSGMERNGSDYVLPELAEKYLKNKRGLIESIQNHIEGCGIKTRGEAADGQRAPVLRGFHSFRHFFISATLQSGASTTAVRNMVGHSSQWIQDKYAHVLDDTESRKAVGLIADSIDTTAPGKASPEELLKQARAMVEAINSKTWKGKKAELLALLAA